MEQHDRRHDRNPFTGKRMYMLDAVEGSQPPVLHCHWCGAYVQPRQRDVREV